MKYLILILTLLMVSQTGFALETSQMKRTIVKVGENDVEVRYSLKDEAGKDLVIETENYGQERINREVVRVTELKTSISKYDKAKETAKEDAKLTILTEIQIKINGAIS